MNEEATTHLTYLRQIHFVYLLVCILFYFGQYSPGLESKALMQLEALSAISATLNQKVAERSKKLLGNANNESENFKNTLIITANSNEQLKATYAQTLPLHEAVTVDQNNNVKTLLALLEEYTDDDTPVVQQLELKEKLSAMSVGGISNKCYVDKTGLDCRQVWIKGHMTRKVDLCRHYEICTAATVTHISPIQSKASKNETGDMINFNMDVSAQIEWENHVKTIPFTYQVTGYFYSRDPFKKHLLSFLPEKAAYPELFQLAKKYKYSNEKELHIKLTDIATAEQQDKVSVLGVNLEPMIVSRWGIILLLILQIFYGLHLSHFHRQYGSPRQYAFPWLGSYPDKASLLLFNCINLMPIWLLAFTTFGGRSVLVSHIIPGIAVVLLCIIFCIVDLKDNVDFRLFFQTIKRKMISR